MLWTAPPPAHGCQDGLGVGGIVLCEAVTRANMRFVETKTAEQQSCLMLHRTRQLFIRQQTSVINAIRAHMAEFGIVAPVGRHGVEALLEVVADVDDNRVPEVARGCLVALGAQLRMLKAQILEFDRQIIAWHRSNEISRRLDAIPALVRHWLPLWLPASPIQRHSDRDGTSRPGSGSCRSNTRAGARTSSVASASKAIAICAACSPPAHSPSFVMPKSTAPSVDLG